MERVEQHLMIGRRVRRVGWSCDTDEMASTYLDVCFPDIEEEESDPLIVLRLVEKDKLDCDGHKRAGEQVSSRSSAPERKQAGRRPGSWDVPHGATKADTVHSLNLSIDLRYLGGRGPARASQVQGGAR